MALWIGIGPFEAFLHSLGLLIFTLLLTLRVESVIESSWHVIFIPLYLALSLDTYYNIILFTRMIAYSFDTHYNRVFDGIYLVLLVIRIAVLTYLEIQIANVLDGSADISTLIAPLILVFVYLSGRLLPVTRSVTRDHD